MSEVEHLLKVAQPARLLIVILQLSLQEHTEVAAGGKLLNAANIRPSLLLPLHIRVVPNQREGDAKCHSDYHGVALGVLRSPNARDQRLRAAF